MHRSLLAVLLLAVTSPAQEKSSVVLRSDTRLVQVDVVASSRNGEPLTGLTASDFTVLQDGVPQKITFFDAHPAVEFARGSAQIDAAPLPHNTFSNRPGDFTSPSYTLILLDLLNTPTQDQSHARAQLLHVIHSLPKNHPVALFTLTSQLTLIEGFTTDPGALAHTVATMRVVHSGLLTTEAERQQLIGDTAYVARMAGPTSSIGGLGDQAGGFGVKNASRWLTGLKAIEAMRTDARAYFTLDALSGISRAVSGYPGRKNLIWLSGSFPVQIGADYGAVDPRRNDKSFISELTTASSLLAAARVAVYPVDIRGLRGTGLDLSVTTPAANAFDGYTGDEKGTVSISAYSNLLAEQTFTTWNEQESMWAVAEQTGGRAFLNTNDFGGALIKAVANGTHFYTLAYTPPNADDNAVFHSIEIKVNQPHGRLAYRRGYYSALQTPATAEVGAAALLGALQPGMAPSTSLLYTVRVDPPTKTRPKLLLHYTINPANLKFTTEPGGTKRMTIDCMSVVFDRNGHRIAGASDTLEGAIPSAHFDEEIRNGIPATQELVLSPGTYYLKTGIMDRNSTQIGTLDIPLVVPALYP